MKILILGSTLLTEVVVNFLKDSDFTLTGHVPSSNPYIPGNIELPVIQDMDINDHDIKLSIQYDKKVLDYHNSYNIHTGLLPDWGGRDILFHTLNNNETEQGLTFHKMSKEFDQGPIISKITYPVFKGDTQVDLYQRQLDIIPSFALAGLNLLMKIEDLNECVSHKPTMRRRKKDIPPEKMSEYSAAGKELLNNFSKKILP
jgi:methionyl-tRNA formyltransferase